MDKVSKKIKYNREYAKKRRKSVGYKEYQKKFRSNQNFIEHRKKYRSSPDQQDARLKYRYGISLYEYNSLIKKQSGVCAICERENGNRKLFVDHCHRTGIIRGLLCHNCNCALGLLGENMDFLKKAFNYLYNGQSVTSGVSVQGHDSSSQDIPVKE